MQSAIMSDIFTSTMTRLPYSNPSDAMTAPESPLIYWRTKRPDEMCRRDSAAIRFALCGHGFDFDERWIRAILGDREGDENIAIKLCLHQIKSRPVDAPEVDLTVSATLANALLGRLHSALFLSWVLKHRARIDPRCALYSDLWLVADF